MAIEIVEGVRLVQKKCARLPDHRPAESVRAGVLDDDGQSCQGSVGG
jgi:hypothetical protein